MNNTQKERVIKKIVPKKLRDSKNYIGEIQFWEESDENLHTSVSTSDTWNFTQSTEGIHLGNLNFSKYVTPKMAKKIAEILKKALSESNNKVKIIKIPN